MIDLHLIFTTSLFIYGFNYLLEPNKTPFSWLGEILDVNLPLFVQRPLYVCVVCMSSVCGTIAYWLNTSEINLITIENWVVTVIAIAGLNRLLRNFIN